MAVITYCNTDAVEWLDVHVSSDEEIEAIAEKYGLDAAEIKEMLQPDILPNYEEINEQHYVLLRLYTARVSDHLHTLQEITSKLLLVYNQHTVISFHVVPVEITDAVNSKYISTGKCTKVSDVIGEIIKEALRTYEAGGIKLSAQVDIYESTILLKSIKPALLQGLYYLKRKSGICKKMLLLTGEMLLLLKGERLGKGNFKDITDMHIQVVTLFDQITDDVNNLLNTYLSLAAQKTNDVMKVLTIFSVFFMPLTFIVGVYGMNFRFMPELNYHFGYPAVLLLMIVISVILFLWMKHKRWL